MQVRPPPCKQRLLEALVSVWIAVAQSAGRDPVRTTLTALLIAVAVSGCSTYNRWVDTRVLHLPPGLPPDLIDKTDGVYKGLAQAVRVNSPACPQFTEGTVEIGDQTLHFAFTPSTIFITPVQPDGTVLTQLADARLDGRLKNGRLQFTVSNPVCETRYDMRRLL
jgi:hypothetical protein